MSFRPMMQVNFLSMNVHNMDCCCCWIIYMDKAIQMFDSDLVDQSEIESMMFYSPITLSFWYEKGLKRWNYTRCRCNDVIVESKVPNDCHTTSPIVSIQAAAAEIIFPIMITDTRIHRLNNWKPEFIKSVHSISLYRHQSFNQVCTNHIDILFYYWLVCWIVRIGTKLSMMMMMLQKHWQRVNFILIANCEWMWNEPIREMGKCCMFCMYNNNNNPIII